MNANRIFPWSMAGCPGNKKGRGLGACGLGKTLSLFAYASKHLQTTGLVKLKKLKKKK